MTAITATDAPAVAPAAAFFHAAMGDQNQFIHFFKNVAIAGGLLQITAFGPGRFAISR